MTDIDISLATETDIPALCRLLEQLFRQEAEFEPDVAAQSRGLAMIIADAGIGHVVTARRKQEVIGMVILLYSVSTALGERVAWLEDMLVDADQRGSGIGSLLLEHVVSLAKRNGCRRITLLTDGDNLAAQRFYQRHGFQASAMIPLRLALHES